MDEEEFLKIAKEKINEHKFVEIDKLIPNFNKLKQKNGKKVKVPVNKIEIKSLNNVMHIKLLSIFKKLNEGDVTSFNKDYTSPITLYYYKKEDKFFLDSSGNNRIFFAKYFNNILKQDYIWAEVTKLY
jgi:hypothetical protein